MQLNLDEEGEETWPVRVLILRRSTFAESIGMEVYQPDNSFVAMN